MLSSTIYTLCIFGRFDRRHASSSSSTRSTEPGRQSAAQPVAASIDLATGYMYFHAPLNYRRLSKPHGCLAQRGS